MQWALSGVPGIECGENEFLCAGGFCIMGYKRCNGIRDCPSGNDEDDCPAISIPTGRFKILPTTVYDKLFGSTKNFLLLWFV